MKYIAHRGLFDGPDKKKENSPAQIELALSKGYDIEVDVWYIDNQWYLGHDEPTYKVDYRFLENHKFWIHTKNLDALYNLNSSIGKTLLNFFWHQEDSYTLTSHGYIWTFPSNRLTSKSICVMPEWENKNFKDFNPDCYGICSDFVEEIQKNQTMYHSQSF